MNAVLDPLLAVVWLMTMALAAFGSALILRYRPFIDRPNPRSSHAAPMPRGGGIGIVAGTLAGVAAVLAAVPGVFYDFDRGLLAGLAGGALIVAACGLADDVRTMGFAAKLAWQALGAGLFLAGGATISHLALPGLGALGLGPVGPVLAFLWLIGFTNAFNFMDGLDGLAAGTALVGACLVALTAVALGDATVTSLAGLLAAAAAGFLVFNWPPARLFMGDVGSQFLGFMLAGLGLLLARGDAGGTLILVVPLLMFHFLFDTTLTMLRRWRRGEQVTAAHRGHLYQLLHQSGMSHGRVSLLLALMVVVHGGLAFWFVYAPGEGRYGAFLAALAIQLAYASFVLRRRPA